MRRLAALAFALAWMAGCGANPLLKMAAAEYAPFAAGSTWNYERSWGAPVFSTKVLSVSKVGGISVYNISNYAGIPGTSAVIVSAGNIMANGVLQRKLPYVIGNRWDLPPTPTTTFHRTVDGYDNIDTKAGVFVRCFRLKTEINSYNSVLNVTTTTGTFIWAAPNVGDVQYADIDSSGAVSITARLSSYSLGQ